MDLYRRSVALYGRFSPGQRDRLGREITQRGGFVARDLTRRSDVLVIGASSTALIDTGSLFSRVRTANTRQMPVWGERSFAAAIANEERRETAMLPLTQALARTSLGHDDAALLAAFDLVVLENDTCRFGDASTLRTAADLLAQGRSRGEVVRILLRARDLAPSGRHKIVLLPSGSAVLQWDKGVTTLDGQGFLPLEGAHATLDDTFEQAELAESRGEHDRAARLYETCAQADRGDPIASFNLGNIRLAQSRYAEASLAYQQALSRDANFDEARYNLSLAYEATGEPNRAATELRRVIEHDASYADALFNLARLQMKGGELASAKSLYEQYLALNPPAEWAATARKAITYCSARLSA
ncbi:MAG TPA: tetratricopeptide repeat protein [Rhizomicrobium sp.]|jgi:tetratricopeptide (TPR) repeat protein